MIKLHTPPDALIPREIGLAATGAVFSAASAEPDAAIFNGGGDTDTLRLTGGGQFDLRLPSVFNSIDVVEGAEQSDTFIFDEARFAGIATIDAGADWDFTYDSLELVGGSFSLVGKSLVHIDAITLSTDNMAVTVDTVATALLCAGVNAQNDSLTLTSGSFSSNDLKTLFKNGIDTVWDAAGSHVNRAPVVSGLNGTRFEASAAQTLYLDRDADPVTVTDDDAAAGMLSVSSANGYAAGAHCGIDLSSGRIALSAGVKQGSTVSIDGTPIGTIWVADGGGLTILFNAAATYERVSELLHSLTYTLSDQVPDVSKTIEIVVTLTDEGGRVSNSTVHVDQKVNERPTQIGLDGARVPELAAKGTLIGTLSAQDPNPADRITYKLVDDAAGRFTIQGDKLVVLNGAKIDFEQDTSFKVVVRATDQGGLSTDQSFTVLVQDVGDETNPGTDGDDILIGGPGRDWLSGGLSNDRLHGKQSIDTLSGGAGHDIFVFDTKPNKKTVDRVMDFNVKQDGIWLDHAAFKKLGKHGTPDKPLKLNPKMGLAFRETGWGEVAGRSIVPAAWRRTGAWR